MATPRASHTATPLPGGRVLIIGGCVVDHCDGTAGADSELFDPVTGRFTPGPPLSAPRAGHTATALADGRVLVVGGFSGERLPPLAGTELYDPATGRFTPAGTVSVRRGQTADEPQARLARTERFDPRSGTFRPGPPMSEPRYKISEAVLSLADGRVVIAGGYGVDTYADGELRALGTVPGPERQFPAVAALPDGRVLIAGGYDDRTFLTATAVVLQL
ncbi:Kelch repeat-containing protein [Dactylosporangium cerinum]|uniref:Kelch repeat-containing protein n=1 Tax=Dactylosporangium cerinum TaxID=1434730 RepID=A0ABV9W8G0_9ACTN